MKILIGIVLGLRPLEDPYYQPPRYPPREVSIKPVVVVDYGHSRTKSPVEEVRTGLTEEERSFMKRKTDGELTDEELFQEFLKWKKSKSTPKPPYQGRIALSSIKIS